MALLAYVMSGDENDFFDTNPRIVSIRADINGGPGFEIAPPCRGGSEVGRNLPYEGEWACHHMLQYPTLMDIQVIPETTQPRARDFPANAPIGISYARYPMLDRRG